MATITQRPNGSYQVVIRKGKYKHKAITKTFRKKTAAQKWATRTEDEIEQGSFIDSRNAAGVLVAELIDRYVKEVTMQKGDETIDRELSRFEFLKDILHNVTLKRASSDLVYGLFREMLQTETKKSIKARERRGQEPNGHNQTFYSKSTVRKHTQDLKNVFDTAELVWEYPLPYGNVAQDARRKLKVNSELLGFDRERDTRLEDNDYDRIKAFRHSKDGTLYKHVALFAIETGMRRGEIHKMVWENVDWKRGTYYVAEQKSDHTRVRVKTGREIPLTNRALVILRMVRMHRRKENDAKVWPWQGGNSIYTGVRRIYKKLGIKETTFHDLRHEFGGHGMDSGLDSSVVGAVLGHADPRSTKRYQRGKAERMKAQLDAKMSR